MDVAVKAMEGRGDDAEMRNSVDPVSADDSRWASAISARCSCDQPRPPAAQHGRRNCDRWIFVFSGSRQVGNSVSAVIRRLIDYAVGITPLTLVSLTMLPAM